jgi:predicted nucleic acid-binding protein
VIVVDASAAVSALLRAGAARERMSAEALHAPHLLDTEVVAALRTLVLRKSITNANAGRAIAAWTHLGLSRYPTIGLVDRIWELRSNVSAYDAAYVALAETLQCSLITADRRLAAAPGPRCAIEVIPR